MTTSRLTKPKKLVSKDPISGFTDEVTKNLYNVEIYNGKTLLGVVTVTATSNEDASNQAIKDINVKIRRAYN